MVVRGRVERLEESGGRSRGRSDRIDVKKIVLFIRGLNPGNVYGHG